MNRRRQRSAARLRYLIRQLPKRRGGWILPGAYRVVLVLAGAVAIDLAFPGRTAPDLPVLEEGIVAGEDIIASIPFPVFKSESELSQARTEAANAVRPIFEFLPEVADSAVANANTFFAAIELAISEADGDVDARDRVGDVLEQYRIAASEDQLELLMSRESRQQLAAAVEGVLHDLLRPGVATASELGAATSSVILRRDTVAMLVAGDSISTMQEFFERAALRAPAGAGIAALRLYQNLVIRFSEPTIRLNRDATEAVRVQARQAVDPVKYNVLEGERIVSAHERVGAEEMERLRAYEARLAQQEGGLGWEAHAGSVLFNALLLIIFGLTLKYFRPEVYGSTRSITLLWVLVLVVSGAAALISRAGAPPELIPVAFAALILATLYDSLLALLAVFVIVALVAGRPPLLSMTVLFSTLMGGSAAALSGRVVRRRAHTWVFAAAIAGAYALAAVSLGLMLRSDAGWVLNSTFWGTVNGVGSTLLATGLLPLAESLTRITTDQSLLELADLNRPLLRRLSLEAPGTYAHSINVANLAEAAAREIGANSLLARVGVYYHDIGKVKKPQYFVENQPRGRNPHDKLKPATSASILREHVREGLELAQEAGIPEVVQAFIKEHHGTQRVGFFWEKAKELDPDGELDVNEFTYPGPKPSSKETAITLLADSVESAARVLQDPTPESIEELVDRIVGFKLSEGQLERAPLTLREISTIKEQFVKVLSGMYHRRIDYPSPEPQPAPKPEEAVAREEP